MIELTYDQFKEKFMKILNQHAPIKSKLLRANNAPFMNKFLSKEVMIRSRLRNKFNKYPTQENELAYKKQRNSCVKLFRKAKKEYYSNLDTSIFSDNKKFWDCMKPLFSDKQKVMRKIILIEDEKVISNDKEIAEKMNTFFINAVANLCIIGYETNDTNCIENTNEIDNIL